MDPAIKTDEKDFTVLLSQLKAEMSSSFVAEQSDTLMNYGKSDIFKTSSASLASVQRVKKNIQKNLFPCKICKKELSSKSTLAYHMGIHLKEKPFKCSLCEKQFILKHRLTTHIDHHHNGKDHVCERCHKSFSRKDSLLQHFRRIHFGEKKFDCAICKKSFFREHELKLHYTNKHSGEIENKCKECGLCIPNEKTLLTHECESNRTINDLNKSKTQEHSFSYRTPTDIKTNDHAFITDEKDHPASIQKLKADNHLSVMKEKNTIYENSDEIVTTDNVDFTARLNQVRVKNDFNDVKDQYSLLGNLNDTCILGKSDVFAKPTFDYAMPDQKENEQIQKSPFHCEICNKDLSSRYCLKIHFKMHMEEKTYFHCEICNKDLSSRCSLTTHFKIHLDEKPYKCSTCEKRFIMKHHLTSHMEHTHRGIKSHVCKMCEKSYTTKEGLISHSKRKHGVKKHYCTECEKSFAIKSELIFHHKSKHSRKIRNECEKCGHCFPDKKTLLAHECEYTTTSDESKKIKTQEPPSSYLTFSNVKNTDFASETNENESTTENPLCSLENIFPENSDKTSLLGTSEKGVLTVDFACKKNENIQENSFSCEICQKQLSSKSNLTYHRRIHLEEKPYKCSSCEKQFISKYRLAAHVDITHKGKALMCKICRKTYSRKDTLQAHYKSKHTGEKKFSCAICMKPYARNCELMQHYKNKHPFEIQNKCAEWGLCFPDKNTHLTHWCESNRTVDDPSKNKTKESPLSCGAPVDITTNDPAVTTDEIGLTSDLNQVKAGKSEAQSSISENSDESTETNDLAASSNQTRAKNDLSFIDKNCSLLENAKDTSIIRESEVFKKPLSEDAIPGRKENEKIQNSPFHCTVCKKNLSSRSSFMYHMKIHLRVKPYKCSECEKQFTMKHHLISHVDHIHSPRGIRPHVCKICKKSYRTKDGLRIHSRRHREKKHCCTECEKIFALKSELILHYKCKHSVDLENRCIQCGQCFTDKNMLLSHECIDKKCSRLENTKDTSIIRESEVFEKPISVDAIPGRKENEKIQNSQFHCTICKINIRSRSSFINHTKIHLGIKPYKCSKCEKQFTRKDHLISHVDHIHSPRGIRPHVCKICNKSYRTKDGLRIHSRRHREKKHRCIECEKLFALKSELILHYKCKHSVDLENRCIQCGQCFTDKNMLLSHECKISGISDKASKPITTTTGDHFTKRRKQVSHLCVFCNRAFKSRSILTSHVQTHVKENQFQCSECGKLYTTKYGLKAHHLTKHVGGQQQHCVLCLKSFSCKRSLSAHHKRKHSGYRENTCVDCQQQFPDKDTFVSHECKNKGDTYNLKKSKMQESLVECEICKKVLKSKYYLKTHMKIHLGEKPYKCSECYKQYISKQSLSLHMDYTHRKKRDFICHTCGKSFITIGDLRFHFKKRNHY